MKYFEFEGGDKMPVLGLGTWKMSDGQGHTAVKSAIDMGYRHIDCAWIYSNEADVGRALNESIKSGAVARDDLWVTSKLWNDRHRPEHVVAALKDQLQELQLDYLDLYLIHWPVAHAYQVARPEAGDQLVSLEEIPLTQTWQAMNECVQSGLCRRIGVANFSTKKMDQLIADSGVVPACNQVESHPVLQQQKMLDYCQEKGIAMVAYSPLGSADRPDGMKRDNEPNLFSLPAVQEIAAARNVTVAQVLLAWAMQRGTIPIPKSANPTRQLENLEAAQIELTDDEMGRMVQLDQHFRYVDGTFWEFEGSPYTVANLWDE